MDLCEGRSDRDGEAQKARRPPSAAPSNRSQRLAAGILEQQHDPTAFADELERSHRPCPVQLVLQSVFVSKTIEGGGCRMLRGGQHGQHGGPTTVGAGSLLCRRRVRRPPTRPGGRYLHQRRTKRTDSSAGSPAKSVATIGPRSCSQRVARETVQRGSVALTRRQYDVCWSRGLAHSRLRKCRRSSSAGACLRGAALLLRTMLRSMRASHVRFRFLSSGNCPFRFRLGYTVKAPLLPPLAPPQPPRARSRRRMRCRNGRARS